jgi:hypothetical protein
MGEPPADVGSDGPTDPLPQSAFASLRRTLPERIDRAEATSRATPRASGGQPLLQGRLLRFFGIVAKADPSTAARSGHRGRVRSGRKSTDPRRDQPDTLRRFNLRPLPPDCRGWSAVDHEANRPGSRPAPSDQWASATDLVFDPTLACCSADRPAVAAHRLSAPRPGTSVRARFTPSPLRTEGRSVTGQDLLLSRTMLSNHGLPYVGRFACDWHRLATTDPQKPEQSLRR